LVSLGTLIFWRSAEDRWRFRFLSKPAPLPTQQLDGTTPLSFSVFISPCSEQFRCQASHNQLRTEDSSIFSWGQNSHGQCGFDAKEQQIVRFPCFIPRPYGLEERIVKVACGMRHSAFLTSSGSVYAFGENRHGQLGINTTTSVHTPARVLLPAAAKIVALSLGARHSVFVDGNGLSYATGCNRYGQCGQNAQTARIFVPTQIRCPTVHLVSCGWNFTILVCSNRKDCVWYVRLFAWVRLRF
jgi:alpha-tubulin suppressor-like RCC1 family protein